MPDHVLHSLVTAVLVTGCSQRIHGVEIRGPEAANLVVCLETAATIVRRSKELARDGGLT